MKWRSVFLLISILFVTLCPIIYFLNPVNNGKNKVINYMHFIAWGNRIKVNTCKELNLKKVDIIFKNEFQLDIEKNIHKSNKFEFRKDCTPMKITIFQNGKMKSQIPYSYGKQRLEILYDNILIAIFFHFQTNKYHVYQHTFNIFLNNDSISCTHVVYGPELEKSSFESYPMYFQ